MDALSPCDKERSHHDVKLWRCDESAACSGSRVHAHHLTQLTRTCASILSYERARSRPHERIDAHVRVISFIKGVVYVFYELACLCVNRYGSLWTLFFNLFDAHVRVK